MHDALPVQEAQGLGRLGNHRVAQLLEGDVGAVGEAVGAHRHHGHVIGGFAEARGSVANLPRGVQRHEVGFPKVRLAAGVLGHEPAQVVQDGPARQTVAHGVGLVGDLRGEGAAVLVGGSHHGALAARADDVGSVQGEGAIAIAYEGQIVAR